MNLGKFGLFISVFSALLFFGCNDTVFEDTNSIIHYLSFQNSGCAKETGLAKITDLADMTISYSGGNLKVGASFSTQCSAVFKDSVSIKGKNIDIFLADIASAHAMCSCPYTENFNFKINGTGEFRISFKYRAYANKDYEILGDTTFIVK